MKIKIENRSQLEIKYGKFVDREKERQQFWNQYDNLCEMSDEWNVTVFDYYGMGGILDKVKLLNSISWDDMIEIYFGKGT